MIKKLAPFLILLLAVGTAYAGNMRTSSGSGGGTVTFKQGTISGSCDGIACSLRGDNLSGTCAQVAADNDGDLYCGSEDDVPESGDFTNLTGGNGIDQSAGTVAVDLYTGAGTTGATGSDSGLEFTSGKAGLLRGCADNEILKWDETEDDWNCEADLTLATIGNTNCWSEHAPPLNVASYYDAVRYCPINWASNTYGTCGGVSYIHYSTFYQWDTKLRGVTCNFERDLTCTGDCGAGDDDDVMVFYLRKGVITAPDDDNVVQTVVTSTISGTTCTLDATDGFTDHEKSCAFDVELPKEAFFELVVDPDNITEDYKINCSITVCMNEEIVTGGGS